MAGKLLHVLQGADLRCRHDGLTAWAKQEKKVDFAACKPGDIVVFLNTEKNKLSLLVMLEEKDSAGFLGYYKSPHGRVPPEALEFIAEAIGARGFNMNTAIRKGLQKLLAKKGRKVPEDAADK